MDHILHHILYTNYFEYILKHREKTENTPIRICVNKKENRITSKIKAGYYLKLFTSKMVKLPGITGKNDNGENVPHLEQTEVVLAYYNIVNNDYHRNSRVLYIFVPNKSFGQLLDILVV